MSRPLIAILRGISPGEAADMSAALVDVGIDRIEVPLNSPNPFDSIRAMDEAVGERALVGAGTVLTVEEVSLVKAAGAKLVVSPNCNPEVVRATKQAGLVSMPGVLTPTECFAALGAGADALKVFPAANLGMSGLNAIRAVLPETTGIYMVGGVGPDSFVDWLDAGADGFGLGSALYQAGDTTETVAASARAIVAAWDAAAR